MTTDRLKLFNEMLRLIGERQLASLTENREPRRVLDAIWDDGLVRDCLEQGLWNFATRTLEVTYTPDVEPPFGYRRTFDKPDDYVRTVAVCSDEFFNNPLTQYADEGGFWFADLDTIYVRYVSDDAKYGSDLSLWPGTFTRFAASYGAEQACERLTQNASKLTDLRKLTRDRLVDARSKDAMGQPTQFLPSGSWSSARRAGDWRRGDRIGSKLIG